MRYIKKRRVDGKNCSRMAYCLGHIMKQHRYVKIYSFSSQNALTDRERHYQREHSYVNFRLLQDSFDTCFPYTRILSLHQRHGQTSIHPRTDWSFNVLSFAVEYQRPYHGPPAVRHVVESPQGGTNICCFTSSMFIYSIWDKQITLISHHPLLPKLL